MIIGSPPVTLAAIFRSIFRSRHVATNLTHSEESTCRDECAVGVALKRRYRRVSAPAWRYPAVVDIIGIPARPRPAPCRHRRPRNVSSSGRQNDTAPVRVSNINKCGALAASRHDTPTSLTPRPSSKFRMTAARRASAHRRGRARPSTPPAGAPYRRLSIEASSMRVSLDKIRVW